MTQDNLKILGLDISKSSVCACLLTSKPIQPRQFYYECPFNRFSASIEGVKALLALKPDIAIMEPTGVNYAKLWATHLTRAGVEVRFVGHKELKSYRAHHLALPDKDDDADALALACYYFDYFDELKRFIQIRQPIITHIRELVLRLAHLNRVQNPIINRLRQDLAWQFPEVALVESKRAKNSGQVPLLWGWLAGERSSTRYDNLYAKSVGLGLTDSARYHAQRLCSIEREEYAIETQLYELLAEERFEVYRQVFDLFGFGSRLQAVLLSQIYPLQNYLDADGLPEVQIKKGRRSGKPTRRHLSSRRFQKALGCAPTERSSGDSHRKKVVGGSDLCRKALWQWVFTRIEPRRSRPKNEIGEKLGAYLDSEKAAGKPVALVRSRVAAKAVKLLFQKLVTAMNS